VTSAYNVQPEKKFWKTLNEIVEKSSRDFRMMPRSIIAKTESG